MLTGEDLPIWAARLAELTERSGLTQAELARRAGLSRDSYNRYVRGLTRPPLKSLRSLATLFDVKLSDIDPSRSAADTMPEVHVTVSDQPEQKMVTDFVMLPAASGDIGRTRLRIDADLSLEAASKIVSILQMDLLEWSKKERHT